jgi:hypothetical protein
MAPYSALPENLSFAKSGTVSLHINKHGVHAFPNKSLISRRDYIIISIIIRAALVKLQTNITRAGSLKLS